MVSTPSFRDRFQAYFEREIAAKAAAPLANGVEIELSVAEHGETPAEGDVFTFTKSGGKNQLKAGPAEDPQVLFTMTPRAAEAVLNDPAEDIGHLGVGILKLIVSTDANNRISIKLKAGFLTLFSKGYFGVVTAGGAGFAAFLASRGLSGMGAIKDALKKMRT
jgi:hypothetical protein